MSKVLCYNDLTKKVEGIELTQNKYITRNTFKTRVKVLMLIGILSLSFVNPTQTSALFVPKEVDAYELIVDGETWFVLEDVKQITKALDQFKAKMSPSVNDDTKILSANFVQEVEIVPVRVAQTKLSVIDNLYLKLQHPIQAESNYIVQEGDSAWEIAEKLDMDLENIAQMNPGTELEKLWPGDEIIVSSVQYYLDVNVTLQSRTEQVIHFETKTTNDASLSQNTKKVTKQGVDGLKEVIVEYEWINGVEESSNILSETVLVEPITAEVVVGSKPVTVRSSGTNFGVTTGNLSSDFGWRTHPISGKRSFHDGIDIANKVGTSINAYADGTVTKTGWTDSYGNYIIIDHGGGLETYYIHLSGFDVSTGDSVTTGQLIGRMGKTGSATGSHLQFEIRVNGTPQNPWDYL